MPVHHERELTGDKNTMGIHRSGQGPNLWNLVVIGILCEIGDAVTTAAILAHGGSEKNLIFAPVAAHPWLMLAVKVISFAIAAGSLAYLGMKLDFHWRNVVAGLMVIIIIVFGVLPIVSNCWQLWLYHSSGSGVLL